MPQNEYLDRFRRLYGRRLDDAERRRKRAAREGHVTSAKAQNLRGIRAKMFAQKRHDDRIQMTKVGVSL